MSSIRTFIGNFDEARLPELEVRIFVCDAVPEEENLVTNCRGSSRVHHHQGLRIRAIRRIYPMKVLVVSSCIVEVQEGTSG